MFSVKYRLGFIVICAIGIGSVPAHYYQNWGEDYIIHERLELASGSSDPSIDVPVETEAYSIETPAYVSESESQAVEEAEELSGYSRFPPDYERELSRRTERERDQVLSADNPFEYSKRIEEIVRPPVDKSVEDAQDIEYTPPQYADITPAEESLDTQSFIQQSTGQVAGADNTQPPDAFEEAIIIEHQEELVMQAAPQEVIEERSLLDDGPFNYKHGVIGGVLGWVLTHILDGLKLVAKLLFRKIPIIQ